VLVVGLPVVYVRGFAGGERGIEAAVEDPFYGFNDGSVHVRVGRSGVPSFYQFESPLLRLMIDEGYELLVHGSQQRYLEEATDGTVPAKSIWVHRFYDTSAPSLTRDAYRPEADEQDTIAPGEYRGFDLEAAANALLAFIELIKDKTGAPRVLLVAHSMGGLICRCLLQKVLPDQGKQGTDHVDRLFTYGTPHGGIHFDVGWGLLERARDALNPQGGAIFGPGQMYGYLTPTAKRSADGKPPAGWQANVVQPETFPLKRIFCLVGTNPADYDVALGLSAKAVGPKSDGLVQVDSAYIPGARFAFVHRSHSGRYGMVNSEEGYQNLRRFLFGDLEVTADLIHLQPPTDRTEITWQAETMLSVRGLPIVMHEQSAAHHCPIQLNPDGAPSDADRPVPLVTTFLKAAERPEGSDTMRYVLQVRIVSLCERRGTFLFGRHLEQSADFDDLLVVDVEPPREGGAHPRGWARWASQIPVPLRDYQPTDEDLLTDTNPAPGVWETTKTFPPRSSRFLGDEAAVRLMVTARTTLS
jgi:pimeloyl-ACP methyl ester carboxylesterase